MNPVFPVDALSLRADFPLLADGRLVYLDTAASAQKPHAVIEAESRFYRHDYANIHRGVYALSERATELYEAARTRVARFIGAASPREVVFTRNATEAINLVAASHGGAVLREGDEVVLSELEHHANIVPWQMLRERIGIVLKVAPIADDGSFRLDALQALLGPRTRLVSVAHVSNVLGTVVPVAEVVRLAHDAGAMVLLDGAQAVPHVAVDVQALGCDFYAFSGHKLYGPTGIGVLWAREELLRRMPPYQGGGDMILSVSFAHTTFAPPPQKFEAGTPAIAQAVGLAAAIDYVESIGMERIAAHDRALGEHAGRHLAELPGLRPIGTAPGKVGVVSFTLDYAHPHDIAQVLDAAGIAVRAGHHCAQPLMRRFGVPATVRASFGLYTTFADIDALVAALRRVEGMFRP